MRTLQITCLAVVFGCACSSEGGDGGASPDETGGAGAQQAGGSGGEAGKDAGKDSSTATGGASGTGGGAGRAGMSDASRDVGRSEGGKETSSDGGPGAWVDVTAGLPNKVRVVTAVPGQAKVVAFSGEQYGPATGWSTVDRGATWTQLGQGAGSDPLTIQPLGILFDPEAPDTFWIFGNFAGATGGVLKTTDGGSTFVGLNSPEAEGVSVDFGDPARKTILVGEHEHSQALHLSTDAGQTWTNIGTTLPAGTARSEYPLVLDATTYLVGCSFTIPYGPGSTGGTTGIYRTTDGGASWSKVSDLAVFANPLVAGAVIDWSYYNTAKTNGGILASADQGLTWTTAATDGMRYTTIPIGQPSGAVASLSVAKLVTRSPTGAAPWTNILPATSLNDPFGLTFESVTGSYFAWEINGSVQRLDLP